MDNKELTKKREKIGYGYYEVNSSNATKLRTDEWFDNIKTWAEVGGTEGDVGTFYKKYIYRRKVDVGPDYELVPEKEMKEARGRYCKQIDWEVTYNGLHWQKTSEIGVNDPFYGIWPAFRRLKVSNKNNWVSVKTKMPPDQENEIFVAWEDNDKKPQLLVRSGFTDTWFIDKNEYKFTHWQLVQLPADVEKVETEETAFLKWKTENFAHHTISEARKIWDSARLFKS